MKLNLSFFVPYGPVGHPEAQAFTHLIGEDKNDVEGEAYSYLSRRTSQNVIPTTFFNEDKSLAENGYFVLQVKGDEVDDDEILSLSIPSMFTPAKEGERGRKLEQFKEHIPYFYHHFNYEIWEEGKEGCDHDFGLESYSIAAKDIYTDEIIADIESIDRYRDVTFYAAVKCSRCGAVHALEEKSSLKF